MKKHKNKIILLLVILIVVLACLFIPSLNNFMKGAITAITSSKGIDGIVTYIRAYGKYAAIISFFLMVLQSILAPIPAFLITLANAAIFGWAWGALLSWSSSMVGAGLCFFIARIFGRDIVEKINGKGLLHNIDEFFKKYGKHSILIARLIPFISFDIVSYAAGLTGMGFIGFFIATGIGQLPATIVYSYVGGTLTGGAQMLMVGLLLLFAISIAIYVGKKLYNEKQK